MTTMRANSPLVEAVRADLERRVRDEIRRKKISANQLASKLDLLPVGAEVLLSKRWSLDLSVQVADAIGLRVDITLSNTESSA